MTTTQKPVPHVDELRDDIELLQHFDGCADPRLDTYRGSCGDAMLQCRECGKFRPMRQWMLTDTPAVMEAPPEPPKPTAVTPLAPTSAPALVSTFRCRTHTDAGKGVKHMSTSTYSPPAEPKIPQLSRSARHGEAWPTHRAKARNQRHRSNRKTQTTGGSQ